MRNRLLSIVVLTCLGAVVKAQPVACPMGSMKQHHLSLEVLDSVYASAISMGDTPGVFQTESEQEPLLIAWPQLFEDLQSFLAANDFQWARDIKCFNRVYFDSSGAIDYFLYDCELVSADESKLFLGEEEREYERLLNLFVLKYKINVKSTRKFVQCGPVIYEAKKK